MCSNIYCPSLALPAAMECAVSHPIRTYAPQSHWYQVLPHDVLWPIKGKWSWEPLQGFVITLFPVSQEGQVPERDCTFSLDLSTKVEGRVLLLTYHYHQYEQKINHCSKFLRPGGYLLLQHDLVKADLYCFIGASGEHRVTKIESLSSGNLQCSGQAKSRWLKIG